MAQLKSLQAITILRPRLRVPTAVRPEDPLGPERQQYNNNNNNNNNNTWGILMCIHMHYYTYSMHIIARCSGYTYTYTHGAARPGIFIYIKY